MKTDAEKIAALTDLYCDFAAHLLSIPEITALPGSALWLSERVIMGLPDYEAFCQSPDFPDRTAPFPRFAHPDYESDTPLMFYEGMYKANDGLKRLRLPPFPRMAELGALRPHLANIDFPD